MYSPVAAPRQRRGSTSPQPKSTFQKELEATIKKRRSRGLATDVTPQESEDELASDDDLMAGFNMTSKSKSPSIDKGKSGSSALDAIFGRKKDEEKSDNLNKTWKPPGHNAPTPVRRKGSALTDSDDEDGSDKEEKRWQPPAHKRSDSRGSDAMRNGRTSPEVRVSPRGMSRSASHNSNPNSSGPRPRPRLKLTSINASYSTPTISSDKLAPLQGDPYKPPVSPGRQYFRRSRSQTPKSQLERGQEQSFEENSRKKSPFDDLLNRKSKPKKGLLSDSEDSDSDEIKKTLLKDRRSPFQQKSDERKSPMGSGDRRGSLARKSPYNSRDSLEETDSHRRGSQGDRKSPFGQKYDRKSPFDDEKTRKGSSSSSRQGSQQNRNDERSFEERVKGQGSPSVEKRHQELDESNSRRYSRQGSKDRKGPLDPERYSRQDSKERKSPFDKERNSRQDSKDRDRKSPFDSERNSRQDSKDRDRKSPFDKENRKNPFDQRHRKSPYGGKKGSKHSDNSDDDSDEDSDEKRRGHVPKRSNSRNGRSSVTFEDEQQHHRNPGHDRRETPSDGPLRPMLKNRTTEDGDRPTLQRQRTEYDEHSRRRRSHGEDDLSNSAFRPVPKPRHQEETSSVCDELEKDPDRAKRGTPEPTKRAKSAKGKKTEKQLLDHVIDSIDGAQEDNRMKFIQDGAEKDNKKETQKPKSAKLHKPKPRYASGSSTPNLNSSLNGSFNSTSDIRAAVYNQWLLEREERKKQEMKEKLRQEKEEEAKKRKEKEDNRLEAIASYNAWLESKKDFGKDKKIAKKKEEKKKKKEEEEKIEKKTETELVFRSWKEEKDKRLKEAQKKKKRAEEEEIKKKQEEKMEKIKDSESAFEGWKSKKDKEIVNTLKDKKKGEENNKQEEEYAKTLREEEALESYQTWMARKERQQERERRQKLKKKRLEDDEEEDYQAPWSPAGRTIPAGR